MNRPKVALAHKPELDGELINVSSRHTAEELVELDAIAAALKAEWCDRGIRKRPSRGDAIRVAIKHYIDNPPVIREG